MQLPVQFPDWMPWWAQLILVVAAILVVLAYAALPLSVFGIKPRLDAIEARLDELQGEIRALTLRLPEPDRTGYDTPALLRAAAPQPPPRAAPSPPPIPPASWQAEPTPRQSLTPTLRAAARLTESRDRAEPRLDRPR